jgi:hypothetical protein
MSTHARSVAKAFLYIAKFSEDQFKFGITDAPKRRITVDYGTLFPEGMLALYIYEHPEARKLEANLHIFLDMRGVLCHHSSTGRPSEVAGVGQGDEHMLAAVTYCELARANLVHTEFKRAPRGATESVGATSCESLARPSPACVCSDDGESPFTFDLEEIARWMGTAKGTLMATLTKSYMIDRDYAVLEDTRVVKSRGQPPKIVRLSLPTLRRICSKSHAKRADIVLDYLFEFDGMDTSHMRRYLGT